MTTEDEVLTLPTDTKPSRFARFHQIPEPERVDTLPRVDDRIAAFYEKHQGGVIHTEIVSVTEGVLGAVRYVMQASVYRASAVQPPAAIAHATRSTADKNPVSAEFPLETAETVAVGRALRLLGFGIGPSADELDPIAPGEV